MLDLRQIQYFLCLYEEGNVTRAAGRLNVVQPAVSMQMSRLEKRLGVRLFERTSHGMIPTSAGETMYRLYLPILLDLKQADQLMVELGGKIFGKIAVGIIPSITNSVLADVLNRFGAAFPDVAIRIDEAYSGTLTDWVATGDLDLAIVNSARRNAGITTHPLIEEELVLVQRGSGKGNLKPLPFRQLKDVALVLPSRRHGIRSIVNEAAEKAKVQIVPQIEVDALAPTLKLVAESDLMTVLPAIVARRAAAGLPLLTRRIIEPTLSRQLVYAYRAQRPLSLAMKAFIDILGEELIRGSEKTSSKASSKTTSRSKQAAVG